jgi:tagaturonate reductase
MQYSSKIKSRDIPVLLRHYQKHNTPPPHFALGFAAYLLFMKGGSYPINDDKANHFTELWKSPATVVNAALKDKSLWGADLTALAGFEEAVKNNLDSLINKGTMATLAAASQKHVL